MAHPIVQTYNVLSKKWGSQGWWPVTPSGGRSPRYARAARLSGKNATERFEIALGALLTQNTAWANVVKALESLIQAQAMTPQAILDLPQNALEQTIRSSGYFRQKAKKIKIFAHYVKHNLSGDLKNLMRQPLQEARQELLAIYGIGKETADSILLYALGQPIFVIDAYTRRIATRMGWSNSQDYDTLRQQLEAQLPRSVALYNDYHALLVELAKQFCRTQPLCSNCVVKQLCATGKLG